MILRQVYLITALATFVTLILLPRSSSAITVKGTVEPVIPSGDFMALTMTIDDTKTRFEMTGPDYNWFAFGFDTTTMMGYSLIIEGTDGNRTAVEQNLLGIGNPGGPQTTQNINIVSTIHDNINDLTTIVIERANNTGDANDPVFTTAMNSLNIIWARDSFASPASPNPDLTYHGSGGRGFARIAFSVVPEPTALSLFSMAAALMRCVARRRSADRHMHVVVERRFAARRVV